MTTERNTNTIITVVIVDDSRRRFLIKTRIQYYTVMQIQYETQGRIYSYLLKLLNVGFVTVEPGIPAEQVGVEGTNGTNFERQIGWNGFGTEIQL